MKKSKDSSGTLQAAPRPRRSRKPEKPGKPAPHHHASDTRKNRQRPPVGDLSRLFDEADDSPFGALKAQAIASLWDVVGMAEARLNGLIEQYAQAQPRSFRLFAAVPSPEPGEAS